MKPELKKAATDVLAEHKTIPAAAEALSAKLARDNALRLAAAQFVIGNVQPRETATASTKAKKPHEMQSRRRVGPHRRPKMPTRAQKAAAIRAEHTYVDTIFDRKMRGGHKLGDIKVHELRAIAEQCADMSMKFIMRGYDDAVDVYACTALSKHCVAADPFSKVRDVIKAPIVSAVYEKAKIEAAEWLRDGSADMAKRLIASAQRMELPAS